MTLQHCVAASNSTPSLNNLNAKERDKQTTQAAERTEQNTATEREYPTGQ
jgi:hypothetical protein